MNTLTNRRIFRIFEFLPGLLIWLTFILAVFATWRHPKIASAFFILYAFYWILRIIYLHFHLRSSFGKLRKNLEINWLEEVKRLPIVNRQLPDIYHLVILPMYKEPYNVVEQTFEKLVGANYPLDKIIVVLVAEEKGGAEAKKTAQKIKENFGGKFFKFLIAVHPFGLPGEIPGKGSNETWAVRRAKEEIIDPLGLDYENVLVSVFDVDTQIMPEYFGRLTYVFLTCLNPQRSSFQPIPFFLNNVYEAPIISRVMAFFPTFWQLMQQSRFEQLSTFTSQAMPFKALVEIDFWDADMVSEDSLIFWKFYLHYDGDWRVEPLYYPVSMDANVAPTFWETAKNLYKQQRRWAWGSENIPYMLSGFVKNKKISLRKKFFWTYIFIESFHSWGTTPFLLFIFPWLTTVLGGYEFNSTLLAFNLPRLVGAILNFSVIFIAASAILSLTLLPPKPAWFKRRHYLIYLLQWLLVPVLIVFWSGIPSIESQTRLMLGGKFRLGFWPTPKSRKN